MQGPSNNYKPNYFLAKQTTKHGQGPSLQATETGTHLRHEGDCAQGRIPASAGDPKLVVV